MCDKDNETTGEQRKMQFLQAKGFRVVTGKMGPRWAVRDDMIQEMEKKKRENILDRENIVKAKSLPRVGES